MKTTGIRVQWIQIIFYNPNFQPCRFPELNVIFSLMNSITCSVFFQQNTSFCIDLSVQAASIIFILLLLLVCGQMSLIIRVCCWPWVQKNFRSFFRKIFFHCPCANLFDFSSSLICLSESAFSQRSCSLLTLKVAPRSAAGPVRGTPRVLLPAGGKARCVYNMLSFHLTRPGSRCTDLNSGATVRECGAVTTWPFCSDRAGGLQGCCSSWCSGSSTRRELHSSTRHRNQPDIASTPAPTMLISSFIHDLR